MVNGIPPFMVGYASHRSGLMQNAGTTGSRGKRPSFLSMPLAEGVA